MQTTLTKIHYFYGLRPGELVMLRMSRQHTLRARHAPLWVTRAGDPADYWVMPGESLTLGRGQRYWISAEQKAELRLERPASSAASLTRRLRAWLRGDRSQHGGCNASA